MGAALPLTGRARNAEPARQRPRGVVRPAL